jgi:murein tripeptide amidase MpaA
MATITSDFDHGNIRVIDGGDPSNIQLEIAPDGAADFFQWFYFRVDGVENVDLTMRLTNAHGASYAKGWSGYRAVASYDGEAWFRVNTDYDNGVLTIRHKPEKRSTVYAYFAAYPTTRYRSFVDEMKAQSALSHSVIGETLDGQAIDYFTAGDGPLQFWIIARQHPGETMGSWWMEGFLPELVGGSDAAQTLCKAATVHVIPCMNLDGARRGHLRTNARGVDLNRAWRNTTMEKSPEVFLVRNRMRETGVDFFLDVHGDEAIPNNFHAGAQGIPSWSAEHDRRFNRYSELMLELSKDFQTKDGYPIAPPGKANLDIANNYVAETWGCLSITLEMPFKDVSVNPMPKVGWSPERRRNFAREHLQAMAKIAGEL